MKLPSGAFYEFLEKSPARSARLLLVALLIPLALSFAAPLWRISMEAPQYPYGLYVDIYSYTVEGGGGGQHLQEINTLNHYIGMHKIDRHELSDLDWLPFGIGVLALLTLRAAVVGNVRSLIDLTVLTYYVLLFAVGRFYYRLYLFGHDLSPDAPVKVSPFTPVIIGTKQIANFTTHGWPRAGAAFLCLFALGVAAITLWQLVAGRARWPRWTRAAAQTELPSPVS